MTKTMAKSRLDEMEMQLSPKEWAIRLADEIREYPGLQAYIEAALKSPASKAALYRPYRALQELAAKHHPGRKPEDITARNQLAKKLAMEFHALKQIILDINERLLKKEEVLGLSAALRLAQLQTLVLQDAFGETVRKAALWVKEYPITGAEKEDERQTMLSEMAAYPNVSLDERAVDHLPIGMGLRVPSPIEDWVREAIGLITEVFACRDAVLAVQDKYFDGHDILFRGVDGQLDKTIEKIETGAATFNEYLLARGPLFKTDLAQEDVFASTIPCECEERLHINLEAVKDKVKAHQLVDSWVKSAQDKTLIIFMDSDDPDQCVEYGWGHMRGMFGAKL